MIHARGLARTYKTRRGDVDAVRGVDLDVEAGEIVGFLGPNGAGKTTTLRMLTTLLRPTRGELEWAAGYLDRIRGGAYGFQGEPPLWNPTPEQLEVARAAGVGPWVVYAMADEDT